MITADQLAALLRSQGHNDHGGMFCDEAGFLAICGATDRTLRRWRAAGKRLPPHVQLAKIMWDLEDVAEWLNAGGISVEKKSRDVSGNVRDCPSGPAGSGSKIGA